MSNGNEETMALADVYAEAFLHAAEEQGQIDEAAAAFDELLAYMDKDHDFETFLIQHPQIQAIFFNGQKAESAFRKLVFPTLSPTTLDGLTLTGLPSTSPANTQMTKAEKVQA